MAADRGFTRVALADGAGAPGLADYDAFLAAGHHGDMGWMAQGRGPRAAPGDLLPGVRGAAVLGIDYAWPRPPDPGGLTGKVASYAWGRDYHNQVGKRLRKLCAALRAEGIGAYGGVDSRPLIERAWAARAGLGFPGKNCLIIVPGQTSFLFLAVVLVDVPVEPDVPLGDHCGPCRRCLDACPTDAFLGPNRLDARSCISYLSIEHRGPIDPALRPGMGRWVFGCDVCQEVCPHNPRQPSALEVAFAPLPGRAWLDLAWVLDTDDDALMAALRGSPLRRPGAAGLKRNAAIVCGNLGEPAARPHLHRAEHHPDAAVRDAVRWALDRC